MPNANVIRLLEERSVRSPEEDSRLITSSSADDKPEIPFNPVYRNFDKGLQEITDWIEKRLC